MLVLKLGPNKRFVDLVFDGFYEMRVKDWVASICVWPKYV